MELGEPRIHSPHAIGIELGTNAPFKTPAVADDASCRKSVKEMKVRGIHIKGVDEPLAELRHRGQVLDDPVEVTHKLSLWQVKLTMSYHCRHGE